MVDTFLCALWPKYFVQWKFAWESNWLKTISFIARFDDMSVRCHGCKHTKNKIKYNIWSELTRWSPEHTLASSSYSERNVSWCRQRGQPEGAIQEHWHWSPWSPHSQSLDLPSGTQHRLNSTNCGSQHVKSSIVGFWQTWGRGSQWIRPSVILQSKPPGQGFGEQSSIWLWHLQRREIYTEV